jgi:DNA-binding SARP family transcriptional activator
MATENTGPSCPGPTRGPGLWLQLVGEFQVFQAGVPIPAPKVGSRKARTLLTLLAVRRGHLVTVDRVAEVVWGADAPKQVVENVATLVSRLRSRLGREAIKGSRNGGYRLGETVRVDLGDAAGFVGQAEAYLSSGQPASAVTCVVQALDLLDDAVVLAEEADAAWTRPAQLLHAQLLRRARHARAEAALRVGDTATATKAAEAAVLADPLDEPAYRSLMVAYHLAGQPTNALTAYQQLRTALATKAGTLPSRTTRELHIAIQRDADPR